MTNVEIVKELQANGVSVHLTEEGQHILDEQTKYESKGIDYTMNTQTTTKEVDIKQLCQALGINVQQFLADKK